jgi:hypothetical protein
MPENKTFAFTLVGKEALMVMNHMEYGENHYGNKDPLKLDELWELAYDNYREYFTTEPYDDKIDFRQNLKSQGVTNRYLQNLIILACYRSDDTVCPDLDFLFKKERQFSIGGDLYFSAKDFFSFAQIEIPDFEFSSNSPDTDFSDDIRHPPIPKILIREVNNKKHGFVTFFTEKEYQLSRSTPSLETAKFRSTVQVTFHLGSDKPLETNDIEVTIEHLPGGSKSDPDLRTNSGDILNEDLIKRRFAKMGMVSWVSSPSDLKYFYPENIEKKITEISEEQSFSLTDEQVKIITSTKVYTLEEIKQKLVAIKNVSWVNSADDLRLFSYQQPWVVDNLNDEQFKEIRNKIYEEFFPSLRPSDDFSRPSIRALIFVRQSAQSDLSSITGDHKLKAADGLNSIIRQKNLMRQFLGRQETRNANMRTLLATIMRNYTEASLRMSSATRELDDQSSTSMSPSAQSHQNKELCKSIKNLDHCLSRIFNWGIHPFGYNFRKMLTSDVNSGGTLIDDIIADIRAFAITNNFEENSRRKDAATVMLNHLGKIKMAPEAKGELENLKRIILERQQAVPVITPKSPSLLQNTQDDGITKANPSELSSSVAENGMFGSGLRPGSPTPDATVPSEEKNKERSLGTQMKC